MTNSIMWEKEGILPSVGIKEAQELTKKHKRESVHPPPPCSHLALITFYLFHSGREGPVNCLELATAFPPFLLGDNTSFKRG